jgi:elongation factor Ts
MSSLELIKTLREKTGASLQACKKAIDEAGGDEAQAIDILRKKGEAKAAKRADNSTNEGVIVVVKEGNKAVMVKLGCETDFVAKNDDFVKAAEDLAKEILGQGEGYDATEYIQQLNVKMGEKVELAAAKHFEGNVIGDYVHSNGKVAATVVLSEGDEDTARDIAMHITAMNPIVISPDEVSEDLVVKEKEIWKEQLQAEGKPAEIMDKIMAGKEKKFREESALIKQPFVKNPDQSIEDLLNGAEVISFARLEC